MQGGVKAPRFHEVLFERLTLWECARAINRAERCIRADIQSDKSALFTGALSAYDTHDM